MRSIVCLMIIAMVSFIGCSTNPGLRSESGKVSGKLSHGDGKPVSNVGLTLQPLDEGHVVTFQVAEDGSFQGEAIPGKYAYYVGKSSGKNADAALKKVGPQFLEANMARTVVVEAGKELALTLK